MVSIGGAFKRRTSERSGSSLTVCGCRERVIDSGLYCRVMVFCNAPVFGSTARMAPFTRRGETLGMVVILSSTIHPESGSVSSRAVKVGLRSGVLRSNSRKMALAARSPIPRASNPEGSTPPSMRRMVEVRGPETKWDQGSPCAAACVKVSIRAWNAAMNMPCSLGARPSTFRRLMCKFKRRGFKRVREFASPGPDDFCAALAGVEDGAAASSVFTDCRIISSLASQPG